MKISKRQLSLLLVLCCSLITNVAGTAKCVWVRGALQCHRDPSKHQNVEVRVIDRDGWGPLKLLDPDDMMGVTFTEPDGTFQLDGCGNDFNIIPGIQNLPDPFVRIHHFCNSEKGETLELPEFRTFVPDTYDLGILVLDDKPHSNGTVSFPVPENPRRRGQRPASVGATKDSDSDTDSDNDDDQNQKKDNDETLVTLDLPTEKDKKDKDPLEPLPPGKTVQQKGAETDEPELTVESVELLSPDPEDKKEASQERLKNYTNKKNKKQTSEEKLVK